MQLVENEEQGELRTSVRKFLAAKAPLATTREVVVRAPGYDTAVWTQMAELGLQGLMVPEELGGSGAGFVELAIVIEEAGRVLLPGPFFSTAVLAVGALLDSGDTAACRDLLPGLASGERTATVVLAAHHAGWDGDPGTLAAEAVESGGQWRVSAEAGFVLDGGDADLLLVGARTSDGVSLFAVEGEAAGVSRAVHPCLDETRQIAAVHLDEARGRLVGTAGSADRFLRRTTDRAVIALAAEQVGAAQQVLDMAVEHAMTREQFGRPIGSFQAIKHKASEMLMRLEAGRAAMRYGVWAVDGDTDDVPVVARVARAECSEAFSLVAGENIQIHGGIGFTWEHDAHLYFKRAAFDRQAFADPSQHRLDLLEQIGV